MATTRGNQEILQRVVQCFRTGTAAGPFSDSDLTDTDACAVQYNTESAGSYQSYQSLLCLVAPWLASDSKLLAMFPYRQYIWLYLTIGERANV